MICEPHWFLISNRMWFMKVSWKSSSKTWRGLTLNNKLNHFLFEYFYENSVVEKAEDLSYNVWNMNHISLLQKKECGSWKSVISECHNLWFTLKPKINHFLSKYLCKNGIVEKPKYWTLNVWNMNRVCFLLGNEFGSLKMYIFQNVTICGSH